MPVRYLIQLESPDRQSEAKEGQTDRHLALAAAAWVLPLILEKVSPKVSRVNGRLQ